MRRIVCAAVAALFLLPTYAQAATVEVLSGNVSVNGGEGFQPVGSGAVVNPGNSVMAAPGSSGDIVYENGCRVRVEAGSVAVVALEAPTCAADSAAGQGSNNFGTLAVGALVIGGAAAAIAIVSSGDDAPASGQ